MIARLQGRRGQLGEVSPLGDKDDRKGGHERAAMAPLLPLEFALVIDLLVSHEVLPDQERGHYKKQKPRADPDRFSGQQAEQ